MTNEQSAHARQSSGLGGNKHKNFAPHVILSHLREIPPLPMPHLQVELLHGEGVTGDVELGCSAEVVGEELDGTTTGTGKKKVHQSKKGTSIKGTAIKGRK